MAVCAASGVSGVAMSIRAIKWAHQVLPLLDLPPTERMTLVVLAYHHNHSTGECFPSMETMAQSVGVTSRRVQQAVALLASWGLIKKKRGGTKAANASNRYTLFGAPKRPRQTGNGVRVSSPLEPEQKSRFETRKRVPVSIRKTVSNERETLSDAEKAHASGLKILNGGRNDA